MEVVEFLQKSGYVVFPTPKNGRDGKENEMLQNTEKEIMSYVGEKIGIDQNK